MGDTYDQVYNDLEAKKQALSERTGPDYEQYLSGIQEQADQQTRNIATAENEVNRLTILAANASGRVKDTEVRLAQAESNYEIALSSASAPQTINNAAAAVATARINYDNALQAEQTAVEEINAAEQQLEIARSQSFSVLSQEQYESQYNAETDALSDEVQTLEARLEEAETSLKEELKTNPNRIGFSEMTDEQQQVIIDQEKEKLTFVRGNQADKIRQGTYGRAVGNVQKELLGAYGQAILENASVSEIIEGINKLPGATIIGEFFAALIALLINLLHLQLMSF